MKSWKPRRELLTEALREVVSEELEGGGSPPMPDAIESWLGQLALLYGVPFDNLVPDYRMLPPESLRFFYLDPNWVERLREGALAIGPVSTVTLLAHRRLSVAVRPAIERARAETRSRLRRVEPPESFATGVPTSGFLLRSIAVSGWPGLEVRGFASGVQLPLLRMDALSSEVLLVLFEGVPDDVQINEPPEGLHFGVRTATGVGFSTFLRGLGFNPDTYPAGVEIAGQPPFPVPMRPNAPFPGVVDVGTLAATLQQTLSTLNPPAFDPAGTFTSCELALEMLRGAGLQEFESGLVVDER